MKKQMITFVLVAVFVFAGVRRTLRSECVRERSSRRARTAGGKLESRFSGVDAFQWGSVARSRTRHNAKGPSDLRSKRTRGGTAFAAGAHCGNDCGRMQEAAKVRGTNDTAQTVLGYDAYFGTFTVNEKEGFVVHHLESALFPGDVGKDIKRNFTISGDRLTIKFNTTTADGTPVTRTLVWERMK